MIDVRFSPSIIKIGYRQLKPNLFLTLGSIFRLHLSLPFACVLSLSSYSWSSFLCVSLCHPSPALHPAHWPPGIGVCVCVYRGHLSRQLPGIWPSHPRSCGNLSRAERFIHLFIVQISSHLWPRHASLVDPYRGGVSSDEVGKAAVSFSPMNM